MDEGDIDILKTYGQGAYAKEIKKIGKCGVLIPGNDFLFGLTEENEVKFYEKKPIIIIKGTDVFNRKSNDKLKTIKP